LSSRAAKAKTFFDRVAGPNYPNPEATSSLASLPEKKVHRLVLLSAAHIVLKQYILFNSGQTISLMQTVSVLKSMLLVFNGLGQRAPFIYLLAVGQHQIYSRKCVLLLIWLITQAIAILLFLTPFFIFFDRDDTEQLKLWGFEPDFDEKQIKVQYWIGISLFAGVYFILIAKTYFLFKK
jgi:hypothetical protein